MLRVDPQGFVEKYMRPVVADNSWKLLFKTESLKLKKFPDYYPLYQDVLLEQTAAHARLGESFANVRARLINKLPKKLDGFIPGYKPLKLLAQTLMWKAKTQNDFFSYLCHGHYQDFSNGNKKDLILSGCKPDYINRKTPRGRIRFLLRPSGVVGCNNVNTLIKDENMFACDVTYPDFTPRLRIKSPMVAGNWFNTGVGDSRIYAVVIHVPKHEKITKVQLIIDGKMIDMQMTLENGVSRVYSVAYSPLKNVPSLMKGYFFHAEINGKNFFYPAQFYYDWEEKINLTEKQRYNGFCKVPFPDRTCDVCDDGYRVENGECIKCTMDNCNECTKDLCTKCAPGFLLSNGECKTQCIANCTVCSSASTCDKCKPTHFLENGTCNECSTKFQDCATCTQDKCLTYFCQFTDPECDKKRTPGQYFSEVTQKCEKCPEGCKHCMYDHLKGSKCTICNNGLFLTSEGECIPCYYVDGCLSGQCDGYKCLKCKKGYYHSGKGCIKCDENCEQCVEGGKCISCAHGFILDKEYGKCVDSYEDENCLTKDAQGLCSKCKPGYGLNRYQRCMPCDASCKQCTYADKCDVCKDTFYNIDGHCEPCSKRGCDLCDAKECFSCQPNAFLHNGVCIRGPPGCSLCHDKAPICRVCEKGMKMKDGHCVPDCDVKHCSKCNPDGTCRYCKSKLTPYGGYEPAPNGTEPCPFVCDPVELNCFLTDKMKKGEEEACFARGCKICPPHTYPKDHKCVVCGEGCDNCVNDKECLKCLPGYIYHNGKCEKCNKDGTCGEGEYKEGCGCKDCKKKFPHCLACNIEQCIVCEENFIISHNKTTCEPCTKAKCPKPEPICKNSSAPFSRVGDEMKFDPMCKRKDNECYCVECACGYELSPVTHTCVEIPEERRLALCCDSDDGCCTQCAEGSELVGCECIKKCRCGVADDGVCREEKLTAVDNCLILDCLNNCTKCLDGYHLVNGKCEKCMDNCSECPTNTTCSKCSNGYYLNETTLVCDKCKECSGVCDKTGAVCLSCADGQYLNEITGKCEYCAGECHKCVSEKGVVYCTLCEDGTVPINGTCGARSLSFSRSGTSGVSILVAVAMILAILLWN